MLMELVEGIPGRGLLSVREIAEALNVEPDTIRQNWIHTGIEVGGRLLKLAALRVGGSWRVERKALLDFLAACNGDSANPTRGYNPRRSGPDPEEVKRKAAERLRRRQSGAAGS